MGKKNCKIVVIDWIEDCLIKNPTKPKLVSDRDYTLEKTLARVRKGQNGMEESEKKFEEGVKACKELCDSSMFSLPPVFISLLFDILERIEVEVKMSTHTSESGFRTPPRLL